MNDHLTNCPDTYPPSALSSELTLTESDINGEPNTVSDAERALKLSEPRRVLITGAGGLLGRNMSEQLSASGWQIIPMTHYQLDITNESAVMLAVEVAAPDVLVNCAATADVDRCEIEPEWAYSINTTGPTFLARACRRVGAEIVHVSTDYVFDGSKREFYTQSDEPRPLSVYGSAKLAGELAVREENPRSYVVRTSWLFGQGGKNFGSRVIGYARSGARLKGVTDQVSIPSYAPDVAARIEEIIDLANPGLYHVTSSGPTSWFDFARQALDLAGLGDIEIEPVTRAALNQRAPRPQYTPMKCLLSEQQGLVPLRHWQDTLAEFLLDY